MTRWFGRIIGREISRRYGGVAVRALKVSREPPLGIGMKFKGYLAATGSVAYRGYLIERNTFTGTYMIRKNGAHIAWAPTVEKARDIIDNLGRALARFCTCDEGRDICRSCAGGI